MAHQPKSTGEHTTPETLQSLLISQGDDLRSNLKINKDVKAKEKLIEKL